MPYLLKQDIAVDDFRDYLVKRTLYGASFLYDNEKSSTWYFFDCFFDFFTFTPLIFCSIRGIFFIELSTRVQRVLTKSRKEAV